MSILFGVVDPTSSTAHNISTNLLKNWTPIGAVAPELPENISPFISSFEIQAHFTIGETARALELIRRCWGWYLNNPNGTESTVIEGYLQNGTFAYRSSRGYFYDTAYVSHAHGWSSGPTSALTEYVLGLSITSPVGKTWKLTPQFGDLTSAEGGFTTTLGKFQAGWNITDTGYTLSFAVPEGTTGSLILPVREAGVVPSIVVDGKEVKGTRGLKVQNGGVVLEASGGRHSIIVGY